MKVSTKRLLWQIDSIPQDVLNFNKALRCRNDNYSYPFIHDQSNLTKKFNCKFWFSCLINYFGPVFLVTLWSVAGVFSGNFVNISKPLLIFSFSLLCFVFICLSWQYFKNHCYLFYFVCDHRETSENTLSAYLEKINKVASKGLLNNLYAKCVKNKIYIRSTQSPEELSSATKNKICQIFSTAIYFDKVIYVQNTKDKYYLSKTIFLQRLPEICVALCSLWALSFGFHTVFGAVFSWVFLMLTLVWYYFRLISLLKSMRIWAPTLPYLEIHPIFQDLNPISPSPKMLWREQSLDAVGHSSTVVGWIIQAVISLYLLMFTQMIIWNQMGVLWNKKAQIKIFYVFLDIYEWLIKII